MSVPRSGWWFWLVETNFLRVTTNQKWVVKRYLLRDDHLTLGAGGGCMGDFRKKYPAGEKNYCKEIYTWGSQMLGPLVPRPIRFGSRGPSQKVRRFPSVRLGYVTEVNWPRRPGKTPYIDQGKSMEFSTLFKDVTSHTYVIFICICFILSVSIIIRFWETAHLPCP